MIRIGDRIQLSESEAEYIKSNARARYASNRASGVHDAARGSRRGIYYDSLGSAGELAFSRLVGGDFDDDIRPRSTSRGEDPGDILYRGRVVQVKTTDYKNGKLVAPPWAKNDRVSEVYALMVLVDRVPTLEFRGFAEGWNFIKDENLSDLGHGPTYALTQDKLLEEDKIIW